MDELRDKYLQGTLTEAERAAFEESLNAEERIHLAEELGVKDEILRNEIRSKVEGFERKNGKSRLINSTYLGIAASILIATSLVLYFTSNQQSLFDNYYQVYENYEVTKVRGDNELSNREKAYAAYDVGNYQQAIELFNELDSMLASDYFFRGVSYIQTQDFQRALKDFEKVIASDDSGYTNAALWYSALIHIKWEDHRKAIPILEKLSRGSSEFASTSGQLLDQL